MAMNCLEDRSTEMGVRIRSSKMSGREKKKQQRRKRR